MTATEWSGRNDRSSSYPLFLLLRLRSLKYTLRHRKRRRVGREWWRLRFALSCEGTRSRNMRRLVQTRARARCGEMERGRGRDQCNRKRLMRRSPRKNSRRGQGGVGLLLTGFARCCCGRLAFVAPVAKLPTRKQTRSRQHSEFAPLLFMGSVDAPRRARGRNGPTF